MTVDCLAKWFFLPSGEVRTLILFAYIIGFASLLERKALSALLLPRPLQPCRCVQCLLIWIEWPLLGLRILVLPFRLGMQHRLSIGVVKRNSCVESFCLCLLRCCALFFLQASTLGFLLRLDLRVNLGCCHQG